MLTAGSILGERRSMLDKITEPADLKGLSVGELEHLAEEIREFLVESISKTGGHIGANLGVVELTVAAHYVFNAPDDSILFDVGHQGYVHKLLTGRKELFSTLNTFGGMSRFVSKRESRFDVLDASHAGTSLSIAAGMAYAKMMDRSDSIVVAIVGDGALVEGMSFEGLNFAAEKGIPLIIIINDNGMSIPKNVGGINNLFEGDGWQERSCSFFQGLGYKYLAVPDGHDISSLVDTLQKAQELVRSSGIVVHVKTEKGKGLAIARDHPYKMHFSMPFDPDTGDGSSPVPAGMSYSKIVGETLYSFLQDDENTLVLTPATPYASGIEKCLEDFPDRAYDVGMAEQHCIGMAAGLALKGKKVFACFQSTFLQRSLDQVFHDACYMDLPITIIAARSGFSGFDSPTHHGIYDLSYLRAIPNLDIFYAGTTSDLRRILLERRDFQTEGPLVILHPYENILEEGDRAFPADDDLSKASIAFDGEDGFIFSTGNRLSTALRLRELLVQKEMDFGVLNVRWINPLPVDQLTGIIKRVPKIVTLEENVRSAGFGSSINEIIRDQELSTELFISAIDDGFVPAGEKDLLSRLTGIDADTVFRRLAERWDL